MRTFIFPYNPASESAKKLSEALGAKRLKREGSKYKHRPGDRIINWGCSEIDNPEVLKGVVLNNPQAVKNASNKLTFFQNYEGTVDYLIPYTSVRDLARRWQAAGQTVVVRHKLNGHSGEGIEICQPDDLLPYAPVYTQYKKKTDEYRVHFVGKDLVKFARKGRKMDVPDEEVNWKVRNLAGGFVYALADYDQLPEMVLTACEDYVDKTSLYFGAIDVIYHKPTDRAYVLEVNTAPGLSGSTIDAYAEAFRVG